MNQRRIDWSLAVVVAVAMFLVPLAASAMEIRGIRPVRGIGSISTSSPLTSLQALLERACEQFENANRPLLIIPGFCESDPPVPPPAPEGMVLISEIAWMGSIVDGVSDTNAEWIELMNTGDVAVDISEWSLFAVDGNPGNVLASCPNPVVPANGFFLLARGAASVYGVPADCTYPGGVGVNNLENGGEDLELRNAEGELKDNLPAAENGWPGGNNATKETLQRTSSETWGTFAPTPGAPAPTP